MLYRVTYRPEAGRDSETVEAECVDVTAGVHLVLTAMTTVIGQPREVVVRRLRAAELLSVDEVR